MGKTELLRLNLKFLAPGAFFMLRGLIRFYLIYVVYHLSQNKGYTKMMVISAAPVT